MALTKSWLSFAIPDALVLLNGYTIFKQDRVDRNEEEICIYVTICRQDKVDTTEGEVCIYVLKNVLSTSNRIVFDLHTLGFKSIILIMTELRLNH